MASVENVSCERNWQVGWTPIGLVNLPLMTDGRRGGCEEVNNKKTDDNTRGSEESRKSVFSDRVLNCLQQRLCAGWRGALGLRKRARVLADRQDCVVHKPQCGVCPRRCRWEGKIAAARRLCAASEKGWRSPELGQQVSAMYCRCVCGPARMCWEGLIHTSGSSSKARRPLDRQRSGRTGLAIADEKTRLKKAGGDRCGST